MQISQLKLEVAMFTLFEVLHLLYGAPSVSVFFKFACGSLKNGSCFCYFGKL